MLCPGVEPGWQMYSCESPWNEQAVPPMGTPLSHCAKASGARIEVTASAIKNANVRNRLLMRAPSFLVLAASWTENCPHADQGVMERGRHSSRADED